MTKEQLLSNKAKLEKGLINKNLTDAQKELAKTRLAQIETQLANLEKEAATPEAGQQRRSESEKSKEPESKEPAKKLDKPKATANQQTMSASDSSQLRVKAKKKPKENKESFKSDCAETVAQIRLLLDGHNKKKVSKPTRPATKKRTSEVLADGFSGVFVRAIKRELTLDKVGKIKLAKLREARDKIVECLEAVRVGLGGISKENEGFIEDFKTEVNKIFDEVEERQKKAETRADAKVVAGQQAA
jgi:hypothetical protein